MIDNNRTLTIKEASEWAAQYTGRPVTASNISYLIQYGRIRKVGENGTTRIEQRELMDYYNTHNASRESLFKEKLGDDLNWALSFDQYKEAETTKHVHRLHPYKGKFIPQLVEYFLDSHIDKFKTELFFKKGDTILDPFSGSGTTMVQACELGMNAIGVDVSAFNALIANCKVMLYDIPDIRKEIERITVALKAFVHSKHIMDFDDSLTQALNQFNAAYFPVPEYKRRIYKGEINEKEYGASKEQEFLPIYYDLVNRYGVKLRQDKSETFLDKWYSQQIRDEIEFVFHKIREIDNIRTKKIMSVILSRTMRSCRATTHADLATLLEPVTTTYYCKKHGKVCKPLFSIVKWWETYTKDTVKRLLEFDKLRTPTYQYCITGDSRSIDIFSAIERQQTPFAELLKNRKIQGIFSSPPYVGLIDYHEQHAYAYDLFGFKRSDELEIGPLYKGQKVEARQSYVEGISAVLNNSKKYLADDYNVFLVANDKYNLYPTIAKNAGMQIVNQFKRPVLNRTEKDKTAYSETIFHLREI
jgi:DNA modification methylase